MSLTQLYFTDSANLLVPFFIFGDFNFRCDTEGVVKVKKSFKKKEKLFLI
jgi:hypothetical protein